jgi:hypothetical protein
MATLAESREVLDRWLYSPADGWEAADSRLLAAIESSESEGTSA